MNTHCAAVVFKLNPSVSWPVAFHWCCGSRGDAHNVGRGLSGDGVFAVPACCGPAAFQLNGSALVPQSFNLLFFLIDFGFPTEISVLHLRG